MRIISRVRGSTPKLSLVVAYKIYINIRYSARRLPTINTTEYMLYVSRSLARVLVSSKTIIVGL